MARLTVQLQRLEEEAATPGFWEERARAASLTRRLEQIRSTLDEFHAFEARLEDLQTLHEMAEEADDPQTREEVARGLKEFQQDLKTLEIRAFLDGPYDAGNCYLSLNAGAGGTEAQDWTEMLLRMYTRWLPRRGFRFKVLEASPGEVAGLKSATLEVEGPYAYGTLKAERGVHRLVRISPFDANRRRHTSFASVNVIPQIEDVEVEIDEDDLKIDTYRASGAGGQYVNKTDSAVRITHLPTGIVVACQKERSQHQNKEIALKLLKARLYELERRKREQELKGLQGELKAIEWGSQIRSYVFQPYQLVKDHRTGVEVGNIQAVMDGELDPFIEGYLLQGRSRSPSPS